MLSMPLLGLGGRSDGENLFLVRSGEVGGDKICRPMRVCSPRQRGGGAMSFHKTEQFLELARRAAASRQGISLEDVVTRYEVSLRTAQRMLHALENHFPNTETWLDGQGRKRWRIPGGHLREFFSVSAEEVAAIELGIAHLNRSGLNLEGKALQTIRDKILALLPSSQVSRIEPDTDALLEAQGFVARPGPRPRVDEKVALEVAEAIKACRYLNIYYKSHADEAPVLRKVAPYGLLSGYRRYLVAMDPAGPRKGSIKTYRMDAITSAALSDKFFERPADFSLQTFANRGFALYQNDAEYGEVEWRFAPVAADHVRGTLFHPEQTEEILEDRSIIIRFKAAGHLEMAWYLYQWGDKVEVLKPASLRDLVKDHKRSDFPVLP